LGATAVKFIPGGGSAGAADEVGVAAGCSLVPQAASAEPGADGEHRDAAGLQERPPRDGLRDVAEVVVVAGIRCRLGAGVPTFVAARHMLARRPAVVGDKEVQRNEGHGGGTYDSSASRR